MIITIRKNATVATIEIDITTTTIGARNGTTKSVIIKSATTTETITAHAMTADAITTTIITTAGAQVATTADVTIVQTPDTLRTTTTI